MKSIKKGILVASALLAISAHMGAQAQVLSGIQVEPANAKAGESVKIRATFEPTETPNCGLRFHFGDGQVEKVRVNRASEMPYVITRTYEKAGSYKVEVEPTTAGSTLKCLGKRQSAMLTVAAAAPVVVAAPAAVVPAAPAPAPAAASAAKVMPAGLCPAGWKLAKPGQNAKTKAFTCTAKAGTKIPEPKLTCPGDLSYVENAKKGVISCRV